MFIGRSPNWCEVNVVFREKERKEERESENDLKRESENEKAREREIRFSLMHGLQHMTASTIPPLFVWPCGTPWQALGGSDIRLTVPITSRSFETARPDVGRAGGGFEIRNRSPVLGPAGINTHIS
jgi:hypothetical protein